MAQENDVLLVDDIRNFLFGPPGAGGLDLASLDIQRGRDHGMLDYNAFRLAYGLTRLTSILQLTSDADVRATLVDLYGNVNSIDAWVGGIAEDHVPGSSIGAMVMASMVDQFTRLRDGDRLFYVGDLDLQTATFQAVIDLDSITLAEIIRLNTTLTNLQDNVFFASTAGLAGDFNFDGVVDSADYVVWRKAFGGIVSPFQGADATGDGLVTQADFDVWRAHFGQTAGSGASATANSPVPEPAPSSCSSWECCRCALVGAGSVINSSLVTRHGRPKVSAVFPRWRRHSGRSGVAVNDRLSRRELLDPLQ